MSRVFAEKPSKIPMDADTQLRVCMAIVAADAEHICSDLDGMFTVDVPFASVCESKQLHGHVDLVTYGFVADETMIEWYLSQGYYLCNYEPGRLSIHYPDRSGGGLCTYIVGNLAEKYRPRYREPGAPFTAVDCVP
jgi:hypothetical protein